MLHLRAVKILSQFKYMSNETQMGADCVDIVQKEQKESMFCWILFCDMRSLHVFHQVFSNRIYLKMTFSGPMILQQLLFSNIIIRFSA